jgi:hypothetical protein
MKYRIHFTLPDGSTDSVDVQADSVEQIREKARAAVDSRGGTDEWSEPA